MNIDFQYIFSSFATGGTKRGEEISFDAKEEAVRGVGAMEGRKSLPPPPPFRASWIFPPLLRSLFPRSPLKKRFPRLAPSSHPQLFPTSISLPPSQSTNQTAEATDGWTGREVSAFFTCGRRPAGLLVTLVVVVDVVGGGITFVWPRKIQKQNPIILSFFIFF